MDAYIRQTLTISVAQICNNIGWHSITDSSMNILTDILHHYISDLSVTSKKYAEHAYSDVPDIEDLEKAFRHKSISFTELRRYMKHTGPVKFPHSVPPLNNMPGSIVLNVIKPGSREILTRPIHVHDHLPSLMTEPIEEEKTTDTEKIKNEIVHIKQESEEVILHKRLREISSVVMTSSGFLSPSREGRLADSKLLPFPEIKIEPLKSPNLTEITTCNKDESSQKITISLKKDKSKKLKSEVKKKLKGSKKHNLLLQSKEKKAKVLKKIPKIKEEKIFVSKELPVLDPVIDEIDVVTVPEKVTEKIPKKGVSSLHANKTKMEEILPKFSFFGPLPQAPELIPSTFSQSIIPSEKIEKPTNPKIQIENEDISRKEQKKKKKDKKKEKKEKKKQKDKLKQINKLKEKEKMKEKEKKKDKLKSTNKVPKIKFRFGNREETITKVMPIEKPPEVNLSIIPKPEPIEIDVEIESKPDIPIEILHSIKSPPRVPIHKIKTKIVTKTVQPTPAPAPVETSPPAFYYDAAGNQVWICPMCTKPDDGSPMIGCDGCDVWYHWVCVGIQCPPDCAVWYCPRCLAKRAQPTKGKRGRPRKNKF
ncbi:Zinc finger, PHD-type,Zinc finger, FYVE/PHD-type,Zinc finger, RING/FYVE/PHD-type,Bromodomain [Cinara cedri]|uniref:Zinc finger, PHD-type,Zinc finger, FYVE/PHD-type,Zinc finger, RING/FYVE/PHD-type,Bromodomain n=1 Tax=Cinara cedri TaxID=506608 RepID=A0A5E4MPE2_9HEMI|nr:Zinc finger, PHD-type,Zinc finger, FYVE/PHD-type,Zinc finger, RING/FYVE/PHD-type,Bromodomain [Cinara cedri]